MNTAAFIAKRWALSTPLKHTRRILRMGIGSMALCTAVMVISLCILVGFKNEIKTKVFGFGSHIAVQPYMGGTGTEEPALVWDSTLKNRIYGLPQVQSAQLYALKGALVKGKEESCGVFFKGLPADADTTFFSKKMLRGRMPGPKEVLVSKLLAQKISIDTGGRLRTFFVHNGMLRPRSFTVSGIYATGLEEFDQTYIIGNLAPIQQLNGWSEEAGDGLDIRLKDPDKRFDVAEKLNAALPYEYSAIECDYLFPSIFDWLALIDANVLTLIIIMLVVCIISLTSLVFILIMERKQHMGILKTMGASNALVRHIFIRQTRGLLLRALLIGNAVALVLCFIQKISGILKLDESVYFLNRVPVAFPWLSIAGINLLILGVCLLLTYSLSFILNRAAIAGQVKRG